MTSENSNSPTPHAANVPLDPHIAEAVRLQSIKDETRRSNAIASTATGSGFIASGINGVLRIAASTTTDPQRKKTLLHYAENAMLVGRGKYNFSSLKRSELRFDTSYGTKRENPISQALTYTSNLFSAVSLVHAAPVAAMGTTALLYRTSAGKKLAQSYAPRFAKWMEELVNPDTTKETISKSQAWGNYFMGAGFNVTGGAGLMAATLLKTGDFIESNHRMDKAFAVVAKQENLSKDEVRKYVEAAIPHQTWKETAIFTGAYAAVCIPAALGGASGALPQLRKAYPWLAKKYSKDTLNSISTNGSMVNGTGYSLWPIVPLMIDPDTSYEIEPKPNLAERSLAEHLSEAWTGIHKSATPELALVGATIAGSLAFRVKYPTHTLSTMFLGKTDVMAGGTIGIAATAQAVSKSGLTAVASNWFDDCPLLQSAFYVRSFSSGSRLAMINSTVEYLENTGLTTPLKEKDTYLRSLAQRTAVAKGLLTEDKLKAMSTDAIQTYLETTYYTRKDDHRTEKEKNTTQKKEREIADASLKESRPICPEACYAAKIRNDIGMDRIEKAKKTPALTKAAITKPSQQSSSPSSRIMAEGIQYPAQAKSYKPSDKAIPPLLNTEWASAIIRNALSTPPVPLR